MLLLADVFENFQNMCLEIYELDPARFFTTPGLAWKAALKKSKVKLDLLTDINIVINARKRYHRRNVSRYLSICKTNTKCMKDMIKIKNLHIVNIRM